ncbi:MAG: chromate transporter [Alphaproteobacteria bacterium]|nr:chromate transporter [Alphaproteobacteria bacterium]
MIYLTLFWEFFKIGLLAIGGGLVTIPFLYDLTAQYPWFTSQELTDMIAVSESTPGPIGVNMATFAGFRAAGIGGGFIATLGLLTPSLIIIVLLARYLKSHSDSLVFATLLNAVRPVALALICSGGVFIGRSIVTDWTIGALAMGAFVVIHFWRISPIIYICLGLIGGLLFA